MALWEIAGESGKQLDATQRTLGELGIDACALEFASLSNDELTFTMKTTSAAGAGVDGVNRIPTTGQIVRIYKDNGLMFTGHATEPEIGLDHVTVRVVGPWWWMSQIPISGAPGGEVDSGSGADGTRPARAFPTQGLRESLQALNNAASQAGVPVDIITNDELASRISSIFTVLKTTISGRSWADALAEMINWCPDAVAWYDHSNSTPQLNVTRRGDMAPLTLTVGSNVTQCRVRPRTDLEVKGVQLHYTTRNPLTGKPRHSRQAAGSSVTAKLQMVAISGPDVSDLVPKDDFDTAMLQTLSSALPGNGWVKTSCGTIAGLVKANGSMGGIGSYVGGYSGSQWKRGYAKQISYSFPVLQVWDQNGTPANRTGRFLMTSNDIPEWLTKLPYKMKKVRITGTWIGVWRWGGSYGGNAPPAGFNNWYAAAPSKAQWWANEPPLTESPLDPPPTNYKWFAMPFECEGYLVSVQKNSATKVYRPWEWDYISPPANLAANLRDAQDWLPYEGEIETVGDDVSGVNVLNRKIRVAGTAAQAATMDATLKRVRYDIMNGRTTYSLGPPARIDFGSFISRMRSQKIDRIIYL